MGLIEMSERDLQRIEVLSKVAAGRMTLVSAAHVLDVSTRPSVRYSMSFPSNTDSSRMPHSPVRTAKDNN